MRKISELAQNAFWSRTPFTRDNTRVKILYLPNGQVDEVQLLLHGNLIVRKNKNFLEVRSAGWATPTTSDRINAILSRTDCYVFNKENTMYLHKPHRFSYDCTNWRTI